MTDHWSGTSFYDDVINTSYDNLVEVFGKPTYMGSYDDKTQCDWELSTSDDSEMAKYFTIYDWKEYGINVKNANSIEWHIGLHKPEDIEEISEYLKSLGLYVTKYHYWF